MALNTSAIYLGQAAGASSGGWLIAHHGYGALSLAGLAWLVARDRPQRVGRARPAAPAIMNTPGDGIDADFERLAETAPTVEPPARARPASTGDLFFTFNRLALQGFGGVLAVAQRELVERKGWLTHEEFVEMLALSQVLPGPNVVNLALMFGDRFFGLRGARGSARRHARSCRSSSSSRSPRPTPSSRVWPSSRARCAAWARSRPASSWPPR